MAQKFTVPITVKQLTSAGSDAITVYVDADTYARLKIEAGGRLTWGPGNGAGDVNLYRDGADVLRTDDTFKTPTLFVDNIEIDPTGAQTDYVLKYDGTKFTAASASFGGGGGATNLDGLTDVVITSPEEFQTLEYNGINWVNSYSSVVTYVRNAESTTLTTGTVVYLFGATGDHATVKRADKASDTTSSKTVGLVGANIAASQNGPVITRGYVDGIDLSVGYSPGDVLWLGSNGAFTKTKATAPDHLVFIGVVVRATNNGIVYVATQNGYELDELHNVAASSPSPGDFLKYNGSLWVNEPIDLGTDTVGNYMTDVSAGTGISVTHTPAEGSTATVSLNATLDNLSDVTVPTPTSGDFLKWNGSAWVNDAIDLGTDTTGNYVQSLVAGNNITISNNSGEGATPTINSGMTISDTMPSSPTNGQVWYESDTGKTFVYYDSFWVEAVGSTGAAGSDGLIQDFGYATGQYYGPTAVTGSNLSVTQSRTFYSPIYITGTQSFDRIIIRTGSTFSGTGTVRLGVYNNLDGKPTTVLFDAGTVSVTAQSTYYTITINQTINSGWYWLAFNSQTNATTPNFYSSTVIVYPTLAKGFFVTESGWYQDGVTGAFATASTLVAVQNIPMVGLRAA